MKIKEIIQELSKYDDDLEVKVYKIPIRVRGIIPNEIKTIKPMIDDDTDKIIGVNIGF